MAAAQPQRRGVLVLSQLLSFSCFARVSLAAGGGADEAAPSTRRRPCARRKIRGWRVGRLLCLPRNMLLQTKSTFMIEPKRAARPLDLSGPLDAAVH
jgi:hypothetical protein